MAHQREKYVCAFHLKFRFFLFGYLLILAFGLESCKEKENPEVELYKGPIEEVHDVQLFYSEAGKLRVEVKTPLQYRYANENKVFPDTVNINFFDPTGSQVVTTLRSDSGHFDNAQNLYIVKGHVIVVNKQEQRRLTTPELSWNPTTKKVFTEEDVSIKNLLTGSYTNGKGLDANQDFSYMSIRRPYGIFDVDPGMQ
ncbi:LPS export ABC transporter periplasmic protein LptC [Salmonirosea aquatica]|uniref:LPS export ABC transporter periplasmic protein LptC n=1 Tax=Salmonirosea aquatica TaxID=2654236 RepID=A0A7C9BDB8_9BACT|nr:LPS export ABC transporter periplasmic protein LptC [Cytophagaceae bacterium SJW1-29]